MTKANAGIAQRAGSTCGKLAPKVSSAWTSLQGGNGTSAATSANTAEGVCMSRACQCDYHGISSAPIPRVKVALQMQIKLFRHNRHSIRLCGMRGPTIMVKA